MQIKILEKIKNIVKPKIKQNKKNNYKQNFIEYERNKYGFISVKNKKN